MLDAGFDQHRIGGNLGHGKARGVDHWATDGHEGISGDPEVARILGVHVDPRLADVVPVQVGNPAGV